MDGIPDGYFRIEGHEVYYNPETRKLVILGDPGDDAHLPEEQQHNCDMMGCSSVAHVVFRGVIECAMISAQHAAPMPVKEPEEDPRRHTLED